MSAPPSRQERRRRGRTARRAPSTAVVGLVASATLGAGLLMGPGAAHAGLLDGLGGGFDLGSIGSLVDDPLVGQFIEACSTGSLASGPTASDSTVIVDPENPPQAVVDCAGSTGSGIALVLPESIEVGQAAESMTVDLGDDIDLLLVKYTMGERNLIEILGGVALGNDIVKALAEAVTGAPVDPGAFDKYDSYAQIQADAALPVVTEQYCDGFTLFGRCIGTVRVRDKNLAKRTEALKMAEYLTGVHYDPTQPVELPSPTKPIGSSTIVGDGINVALSMRGGTAVAETGDALSLAFAGADHGQTSTVYSNVGIGAAVDMDTDDVTITWFGRELDLSKLIASGVLDSDLVKGQAGDSLGMLETIQGVNGSIPGLKEVLCYGVEVTARADGLGECANYLGTFDYYRDLRSAVDGEHRQTQYGLTDASSLVLGNDALLKQLAPVLGGGDTADLMDSPLMQNILGALVSADSRVKLSKDFIRYTKDVQTVVSQTPSLDENGDPILDEDGDPVMTSVYDTVTAHWLTSDYGLREPLTIDWLGYRLVLFPPVEVNGTTRPNLIGMPEITKITGDAAAGLLPRIGLVQWDNPFGLGTFTLANPFDPVGTFRDYLGTVTVVDDVKNAATVVGRLAGGTTSDEAAEDAIEVEDEQDTSAAAEDQQSSRVADRSDEPSTVTSEVPEPEAAPVETTEPSETTAEESSETADAEEPSTEPTPEPEETPAADASEEADAA